VAVHDFPDPKVGKAIPFGVYDLGADEGFVVVGDDHDTAAFAVATVGRWWDMTGSVAYPDATRLLITADAGGSNSKIADNQLAAVDIKPHRFHGEWNYTITGHQPPLDLLTTTA
jgi:hypothetical protein